ncbi:MAG: S-layer homology domain-containing protein [Clostridia bacterium]|nr:S-layer homology domain-containing protein [Clostridia bacterium]
MLKRFFSTFLAGVLCVSSVCVAMAAKKPEGAAAGGKAENLYASFGGFDSREQIAMVSGRSNADVTFEAAQRVSGKGSAKVEVKSSWESLKIPAPMAVGETYEISYDVKTDNASGNFHCIYYFDDGGWLEFKPASVITVTAEWQHVSFIWTNTGENYLGEKNNGKGLWTFRYGDGTQLCTYYIDNFSVVPHGDVPEADYTSIETGVTESEAEQLVESPKETVYVSFPDVAGHWAADSINTLATYGYLDGVSENAYMPNATLTRAQFIKMVADTFRLKLPEYRGNYADIVGDEWFAPYVTVADGLGLIHPAMTFGGTFRPDDPITREEAASVAAKVAALKNGKKQNISLTFKDASDISQWAQSSVEDAVLYGLINGYEDGTYRPKNHISRAEAAQILYRIAEFTTRFNIYVDGENGNDRNDGTSSEPLKTLEAAREMVKQYIPDMKNDINIRMRGEIFLEETFELTNEDSGNNGYNIIYTSWGEEKPTLTMGRTFTGFTLHDKEKNIYKLQVGMNLLARQAYFNDVKGVRARTTAGLKEGDMLYDDAFYVSNDTWLLDLARPTEVEMCFITHWQDPKIGIGKLESYEGGMVKITPNADLWRSAKTYILRWPGQHNQYPAWFENAYEFLDTEGEWYLDKHSGYMYYIPRKGEDMSTMKLTLPVGETMVSIQGLDMYTPAHNIVFDNINFEENCWMLPGQQNGIINHQNYETKFSDGSVGMPGAIEGNNLWYVKFTNNKFTRIGMAGMNLHTGIKYCDITGNEFSDVAAHALIVGDVTTNANPDPEQYVEHCSITNNYIHDVATEYKGTAALTIGWARHMDVYHNEIANVSYSGMHIGWGWASYAESGTYMTDLDVSYNFIAETQVDHVYDGGSIYTLGAASKPMTELQHRQTGNYLMNHRNGYSLVYPDEGSTSWHVYENVIDQRDVSKYEMDFQDLGVQENKDLYWLNLHINTIKYNTFENNYATHAKVNRTQPDNVFGETFEYPDGNWPKEAQAIIDNAGIEPEYRDNFNFEGPKYFILDKQQYTIPENGSIQLGLRVAGRYNVQYPLSDFDISYEYSNPGVVEIDENGVAKSIGAGMTYVLAKAYVNGRIQTKHFRIYSGDRIETVKVNANALNMVAGHTLQLDCQAETRFGQVYALPEGVATFASSDAAVVSVDEKGLITANGAGKAVITITADVDGLHLVKEIPVTSITYSQENSLEHPYKNAPADFFTPAGWGGVGYKEGNGFVVTGMPALYQTRLSNQLIAFDMTINNPSTWPSFALCTQDRMTTYADGDTYLIGFKEDHIEFQRFNKGVRTMIFGNEFNPVGGPGVPNPADDPIYTYNSKKPVSVIVGALKEEGGTRIVLTINGVNRFDYLDTDENALPAEGHFGVYNAPGGNFTFSPYTGKTE